MLANCSLNSALIHKGADNNRAQRFRDARQQMGVLRRSALCKLAAVLDHERIRAALVEAHLKSRHLGERHFPNASAVMHRGHRSREVLDVALAEAGLSVPIMLETSVPSLPQDIAKARRGIAVLSDDPLFGLRTVPITSSGHELTITLYGVWDPGHYAAASISRTLHEIIEFSQRSDVDVVSGTGGSFRGLAPAAAR